MVENIMVNNSTQEDSLTMHDLLKRIAELKMENGELKKENESLNAELEVLHNGSNKNGIEYDDKKDYTNPETLDCDIEAYIKAFEKENKVIYQINKLKPIRRIEE